ncbi:RNA polymerase sigma factor [Cecembia rubra]|uniref:RNA polymerase sigma-70 factor (ECF subfamily) n=1 Tax=Cecembia rubra TaxID=1485585 RepID=A0A2P8E4B0_9BACT|nr:RNA polymerase sigma factor [Cecembia rubra]PSL04306.1 RNA polymerase sigma-70 factor (ECF subfamily) [Cecembia rubra]
MINNPKPPRPENNVISLLSHSESIKIFENKSDEEIWKAFDKGDEFAFNYIYRIYVVKMFQYGCQFAKDHSLIQDCIQNIFIDLRRKRGGLSTVVSIKAYLFKILYREIIRKQNKNKIVGQQSFEISEEGFSIEYSHETKLINDESMERKRELVMMALEKLSQRQRQAILLMYEEGMSYKEISVAMEFSEVKSARKVIYRALASLKDLLHEKAPYLK